MLKVGLSGRLGAERKRFENLHLRTPVRWSDFLSSRSDFAALDLVIRLDGDPDSQGEDFRWRTFTSTWPDVPADEEIDIALQQSMTNVYGFVVGYGEAMHVVCRWVRVLAHPIARALTVRALILGETGTGKELVAHAIHSLSSRRDGAFVAVNCGGISPALASSELFGHVRGAFTGAVVQRAGALKEASGGTLFLDELAELPSDVQSQLLRVMEQHTFSPVGSSATVRLDAQIVAATNRDLSALVEDGGFRSDLYFRIAQAIIRVPSLAERLDDSDLLVNYFWEKASGPGTTHPGLLNVVKERRWQGNLRELRSFVERVVLLKAAGEAEPLREAILAAPSSPDRPHHAGLAELRVNSDREILQAVLRRTRYNTAAVARELGVSRRTVYNLLKRYQISLKS
jgi:two-component system NtrC family response regulator